MPTTATRSSRRTPTAARTTRPYREYLDPKYRDEFDAWRDRYKNPFRDLHGKKRDQNWDDERRWSEQESDGTVAEVIFPNTVPALLPDRCGHRAPADVGGVRAAPRRHPGPQPVARRLLRVESPSAGPGSARSSSTTSTTRSRTCASSRSTGCAAARCCPAAPTTPRCRPLYDPVYDPLWAACQDLDVPITHHSGQGAPDYGKYSFSMFLWIAETVVVLPPPARAPDHRWRVRALPAPQVRDDRAGLRVDPARAPRPRRVPRPDVVGSDRRDQLLRGPGPPAEAVRVLRPELLRRRELPEPDASRRRCARSASTR